MKWLGEDTLIHLSFGESKTEVKKGEIVTTDELTAKKLKRSYPRYVELGAKEIEKVEAKIQTATVKKIKKAVLKKD